MSTVLFVKYPDKNETLIIQMIMENQTHQKIYSHTEKMATISTETEQKHILNKITQNSHPICQLLFGFKK